MTDPIYLLRDPLLFECQLMHDAIELRYLPRRIGILMTFIVSALTLNWESSLKYALLVWVLLTLLLRPRIVLALRGTYVAQFAAILQFPLRLLVAVLCSGYIWYATQMTLWNGWAALVAIFIIDFFITFLIESPQFVKIQQEINLLAKLPAAFTWADIELFQDNLPITTSHRPTTPEEKLASMQTVDSSRIGVSNNHWLDRFTNLPPNELWTTYSKDDLANLPNRLCVFVVFDGAGKTYVVGNSEWRGINGDWKNSLVKIGELKPIRINVAWLSENDDPNAVCWWLEQQLLPTAILYNRGNVPEVQKFIKELEK